MYYAINQTKYKPVFDLEIKILVELIEYLVSKYSRPFSHWFLQGTRGRYSVDP